MSWAKKVDVRDNIVYAQSIEFHKLLMCVNIRLEIETGVFLSGF